MIFTLQALKRHLLLVSSALLLVATSSAHMGPDLPFKDDQVAIVDLPIAAELKLNIIYQRGDHGLAVTKLSADDQSKLSEYMHSRGRCGGFEITSVKPKSNFGPFTVSEQSELDSLFRYMPGSMALAKVETLPVPKFRRDIADKVKLVREDNLRATVEWMSAYPTRRHDTATKNDHVNDLLNRLQAMRGKGRNNVIVDLVSHTKTQQKSVRARIVGKTKPEEIVVIGAHYDSINQNFFQTAAPGADDDASGSANLVEIFRLLLTAKQPERTIELMWYAAEEVGLVGSSEIATSYRAANKKVVGVMQLDMTLHPGDGELTMAFMTDFTNPALNHYVAAINDHYVKAKILEDRCGYGCSDHASWHRQGYPAVMPFEATFQNMNSAIHTARDVINPKSSFKHSAAFTRLGLAFAMSLADQI